MGTLTDSLTPKMVTTVHPRLFDMLEDSGDDTIRTIRECINVVNWSFRAFPPSFSFTFTFTLIIGSSFFSGTYK